MVPPRNRELEKDPWAWVQNCNPEDISEEHVKTVYRINVPRCGNKLHKRNCRNNPYCLSRLGEEKWSDGKNLNCDQINDPERERRKESTYVGLKNLGATCYVNSLLQLWFHNLNFRKAIFKWDPLQDPISDQQSIAVLEEKEILKQLQAVFALMQHGKKRFVDPSDFIATLRLDTSIQQDAQEFSKLFLSKLETVLSYQSQKEVRDLIKDNFCGEYVYVTRCTKCETESKRPSKFYELDLNIIKGHKTIQDCLKDFMKIELLEGDNKYFCTVCNEKTDAQRFISLTELPPVLNLQLMRFLYDKNSGHKKKLNTSIQFPEKLNMTEFSPNVKGSLEYMLSAVLVHGGRSANSGHYVALIRDSETGIWYKFNDESVEKIDAKKLKFAIEDECKADGNKKNKVQKTLPKGSYHSNNAYMLVYTRVDPKDFPSESTNTETEQWQLPPHLEDMVSSQNEQFEDWISEIQKYNDDTVGRSLFQQSEMVSWITMLPVDSDSEDFDAIPTSFLTKWLTNPDADFTIQTLNLTCHHGKLNPGEVSDVKYINSDTADKLYDRYSGTHRFRAHEFLCHECVATECYKLRVKNKTTEENSYIQKRLKNYFDSDKAYWIGKTSLKSWRRMALDNLDRGIYNGTGSKLLKDVIETTTCVTHFEASKESSKFSPALNNAVVLNGVDDITCNMGSYAINFNTDPSSEDCKIVNNWLPNDIVDNNLCDNISNSVNSVQSLSSSSSTCNENANNQSISTMDMSDSVIESVVRASRNHSSPDNNDVDQLVTANNGNDDHSVINDTQVTNHNEIWIKRKLDDDKDSSNAELKFNEEILCPHGNLCIETSSKRRLVPEDLWRIFRKYFPACPEFRSYSEPCTICLNIASEDEMVKDKHRCRAIEEKEQLADLYHEKFRPQLPSNFESNFKSNILRKEFYNSWRKFIRESGKKEPPALIQNAVDLLCPEHNKLLYDLNVEIPHHLVMFILPCEWEYLASVYKADIEISVESSATGTIITNPEVCTQCMNSRLEYEKQAKLNYENAKIYVQVVKEEVTEELPQLPNDEWRPPKRVKLSNNSVNSNGCSSKSTNSKNSANSSPTSDEPMCISNGLIEENGQSCYPQEMSCDLGNVNDPLVNGNDSNNNDSNGNTLCHNLNSNPPQMNGKSSPPYNSNTSRAASAEPTAVRRSSRARRGDKKIKINVSSNLVLLDVKKKILEMMEVIPSDQHLFTEDGQELVDNSATLADLSIYPDTVLTLKVDKPCAGNDDSDDFYVSREREQGFVGTILASGPCIDRCGPPNEAVL